MPISVQKILQLVDADGLRALATSHKAVVRRPEAEYRIALSSVYGESIQQLLMDLERDALHLLLRRPFRWRGRRYHSPDLSAHSKEQLLKFAKAIFVRGEIPAEFGKESSNSEFNLDEHLAKPTPKVASALQNAAAQALDEEDGRTVVAPAMAFLIRLSHDWSRPRKLGLVLEELGMEVPERLRASRFQEAIRKLASLGVELADADSGALLTARDPSPGVDAKIRLRRVRQR